jgi:hypothetical protein
MLFKEGIMKVYIGYMSYAMFGGWKVEKVFDSEEKAKKWMAAENAKVSTDQVYDDYGLVEGQEYNYFEMEVE